MNEENMIVAFFVSRARSMLNNKVLAKIAEVSDYNCGLFEFQKKRHLKREVAFLVLSLNDYIVLANKGKKNIRYEMINFIYLEYFKRENKNEWLDSFVDRVEEYHEMLDKSLKGIPLFLAGKFAVFLHGKCSLNAGFFDQAEIGNMIHKYFVSTMEDFSKLKDIIRLKYSDDNVEEEPEFLV